MSAPPDKISELLHSMQSCICDVKAWATVNMLRLNDLKTKFTLVTNKKIEDRVQSSYAERNKYVLKRDLNDDSDGSHLTSSGIEFQTEEEAKENERSPSVALMPACLLRRGIVYELKRVLRVSDGFLCCMSATYNGAVLLWKW